MSNELVKRLIAGISGSAFIAFMAIYDLYTFSFLCLLMVLLLLREFYTITAEYKPVVSLGLILGAFMILSVFLYQDGRLQDAKLVYLFLLVLFSVPLYVLFDKRKSSIGSIAITFMGIIYIALPIALFLLMSKSSPEADHNSYLLIGVFLIIWSNDTGAYFTGKTMGKTKLFERISPNKTIEGSIGGVVLAFFIIWLLYHFGDTQISYLKWGGLILVVSVFGILGDLVESQMKRTLQIKDSGAVIPGHGGFLDRFDALIFALPFSYIYYAWVIIE